MAAKRKSWLGEFWRPLAALLLWVLGMVPLIAAPPLLSLVETRVGGLTAFPVDCIPAAPLFPSDLTRACGPPLYDLASECSVAAKSGPRAGGGASLDNIAPTDFQRIQNAANRTNTEITVVGSRAGGTAKPMSDWDYVLPAGTPRRTQHSLSSSLPEGPRGLGEPRRQDFFTDPLDTNSPHIIVPPQPR